MNCAVAVNDSGSGCFRLCPGVEGTASETRASRLTNENQDMTISLNTRTGYGACALRYSGESSDSPWLAIAESPASSRPGAAFLLQRTVNLHVFYQPDSARPWDGRPGGARLRGARRGSAPGGGRLCEAAADDSPALRDALDRQERRVPESRTGPDVGSAGRCRARGALGGRRGLRVPDSPGISADRDGDVLQYVARRTPATVQLRRPLHPLESVQLARQ